jgi:hypothetical protein
MNIVDVSIVEAANEICKQENALVASLHVAQTIKALNHVFHQQFALYKLRLCVRR